MALEFHILTGSGNSFSDYSEELLALEETEHADLVRLATLLHLPLLSRIQNYYGEYRYSPTENSILLQELDYAISSISEADSMHTKLLQLQELVNKARTRGMRLATFPD